MHPPPLLQSVTRGPASPSRICDTLGHVTGLIIWAPVTSVTSLATGHVHSGHRDAELRARQLSVLNISDAADTNQN